MAQDRASSEGSPKKKPSASRQPSAAGKLSPKPGQKMPHPPKGQKKPESGKLELRKPRKPARMTRDEADRTIGQTLQKPPPKKPSPPPPKKPPKKEKPLGPPKEPISKDKRRLRQWMLAMAIVFVLLSTCVVLSLTVFFKIEVLEVEGTTRYDHEAIIAQAMIGPGDNLLLSQTGPGESNIPEKFPYIEEVSISKHLPNRIVIAVQEAEPVSVLESSRKYVVLSAKGKVLEINDRMKYDVPLVMGARLGEIEEGKEVSYSDENLKAHLDKLITELSEQGLKDVTTVDLSNTQKIRLVRKNGYTIIMGSFEDISYKIHTAAGIMEEQPLKAGQTAVLDVSLSSQDSRRSFLKIEDPPVESSAPKKTSSKPAESSAPAESSEPEDSEETEEPAEPEETEEPEETDPEEWEDPEPYYDPEIPDEEDDSPDEEWTPETDPDEEDTDEEEWTPDEPDEEDEDEEPEMGEDGE